MSLLANYISRIEIHGLWQRYNVNWDLRPDVNILSGMNGIGKTTILNQMLEHLSADHIQIRNGGNDPQQPDIRITFDDPRADEIHFDVIRTYAYPSLQQDKLWKLADGYATLYAHPDSALRFQNTVDRFFAYTGKKLDRETAVMQFIQGDDVITLDKLSSGEKQLLIMMLTMLMLHNESCVVFMDEPEVSLHIEWQQKLIGMMRELNPHAQLILATHSPAIFMDGWMDAVTEMSDIITSVNP
ncbi:MAG: AAA family ATPase [Prevotellaceae bacterium]|jgi:predicted ATPase|nr:AAA family ATPase [Prevotellaceae bacterium]